MVYSRDVSSGHLSAVVLNRFFEIEVKFLLHGFQEGFEVGLHDGFVSQTMSKNMFIQAMMNVYVDRRWGGLLALSERLKAS